MEVKLKKIILSIIKEKYGIDLDEIKLEFPPKKELGDYAFGCFVLSRDLKKNPNQITQELEEIFNGDNTKLTDTGIIESVSSAGPYLNFKLSGDVYLKMFNDTYTKKQEIIGNRGFNNKTIVVDYIGANVGKPLHIGHMCTPNQGQVLVNLYRKLGYSVIADTHIGDWGIIFGKLITAYKLWGDDTKLKQDAINHLLELYIKVTDEIEKETVANLESMGKEESELEQRTRDEFKLLSKGNKESVELWREFTSYSIEAVQKQLDRLNVKADYNIGESFYEGLGFPKMENYPDLKYTMSDIVDELIEKNIATKNDDNSVGVEFDDETKIPSCILQKRDGTHGYLASDLAAIKYRIDNWNPHKIVYFTDTRQQLHFKQAFTISKNAGWINNTELFHAFNGFISLKDGAMSTRKGRIVRLENLLDEAESRAKNIILEKRDDIVGVELDKLSKIIGIGAIKYGYLKKSRETDVVFDWDEFMSFEGNSGPYIQYAYVRAIRILEKSENFNKLESLQSIKIENQEEIELIKIISTYDSVLEKTAKFNMPHYLCAFAYDLTKVFSSFYNSVHILSETDESKKIFRLQLVELFSLVLKDSFSILGIEMPEKM